MQICWWYLLRFWNIFKLILILNNLRALIIKIICRINSIISHYFFVEVQNLINMIFRNAWTMINFQCFNFNLSLLKKIIFLFFPFDYFRTFFISLRSISIVLSIIKWAEIDFGYYILQCRLTSLCFNFTPIYMNNIILHLNIKWN